MAKVNGGKARLVKVEKTVFDLNLSLTAEAFTNYKKLRSLVAETDGPLDDAGLVRKALFALEVLMKAKKVGKRCFFREGEGEKAVWQELEL